MLNKKNSVNLKMVLIILLYSDLLYSKTNYSNYYYRCLAKTNDIFNKNKSNSFDN